jgi:hypothetical protein
VEPPWSAAPASATPPLAIAAFAVTFLGYFVVLRITNDGTVWGTAGSALASVVPLFVLSAAVRWIVRRFLLGRRPAPQLLVHLLLAPAFAYLWYWMLMVLIGLVHGEGATRFEVRPFFPSPAVAWQLLQGLTLYALIVAFTHLEARPQVGTPPPSEEQDGKETNLSRYFIRKGENIYPIDVRDIVTVVGAGDYAEVSTLAGSHLVRMTLAELETALDERRFLRVHRSKIVNLDRVMRAEPAGGGRMLLHMENGEAVPASRAGSRLLREHVL